MGVTVFIVVVIAAVVVIVLVVRKFLKGRQKNNAGRGEDKGGQLMLQFRAKWMIVYCSFPLCSLSDVKQGNTSVWICFNRSTTGEIALYIRM